MTLNLYTGREPVPVCPGRLVEYHALGRLNVGVAVDQEQSGVNRAWDHTAREGAAVKAVHDNDWRRYIRLQEKKKSYRFRSRVVCGSVT